MCGMNTCVVCANMCARVMFVTYCMRHCGMPTHTHRIPSTTMDHQPYQYPLYLSEHCSNCGLCDTSYVANVTKACSFLGDGMARAERFDSEPHPVPGLELNPTSDPDPDPSVPGPDPGPDPDPYPDLTQISLTCRPHPKPDPNPGSDSNARGS